MSGFTPCQIYRSLAHPYLMHILFVCWGNICRSPAAECTFRKLLGESGLSDQISCDSAGTIGSHRGNPPDSRMRQAALGRGLKISGSARMINDEDFHKADLIVTMDDFNFSEVNKLAPEDSFKKRSVPSATLSLLQTEKSRIPTMVGRPVLKRCSICSMMGVYNCSITWKKFKLNCFCSMSEIDRAITESTGSLFCNRSSSSIGGGCINQASQITGEDGRRYFVKKNHSSFLPFFRQKHKHSFKFARPRPFGHRR